MKHAREDYNRIQDPENKIPEDEPVFLLRGQDIFAPDILLNYAIKASRYGLDELAKKTKEQAEQMRKWQKLVKIKIPDL